MAELREEDLVDYDFDEPASVASTVPAYIQAEPSTGSPDGVGVTEPSSANRSATESAGLADVPVPRLPEVAVEPASSAATGMDTQPAVVEGQSDSDERCARVNVADIR